MRSMLILLLLIPIIAGCARNISRTPLTQTDRRSTQGLGALAATKGVLFGTAVSLDTVDEDARYRTLVSSEFAAITPENELKFDAVHPEANRYDFSSGDALATFAEQHGLRFRGHTLLWYRQLPKWVTERKWTKTELEQVLCDHVTETVGHFRGRVYAWDVVNEAIASDGELRPNIWLNIIGPEYIDQAFRCARAADPQALLFYNDFDTEVSGAKADAQFALIKGLLDRGVSLDGVGFQFHLLPDNKKLPLLFERAVRKQFARIAALGLDVQITEMDVALKTPADSFSLRRQATLYADVMQACLLTPRCTAFSVWGVADQYSWILKFLPEFGAPLLFDAEYKSKPAYSELQRSLQ